MTTQRKIEITGAIALLVVAAVFLLGWKQERDDRNKAYEATAIIAQQIAEKDNAIALRDAQAKDYSATIAAQQAALKTPQQAVQVITKYLPTADAQAVPVVVQRADLTPTQQAQLPDAPSYTVLTAAQAQDVAKNDLQCDADRNSLKACIADRVDMASELGLQKRATATWEAAAKGGTKWQRFGRVLKTTACAAGGGFAAAQFAPQANRGVYAGAGAAGGVVICSMF